MITPNIIKYNQRGIMRSYQQMRQRSYPQNNYSNPNQYQSLLKSNFQKAPLSDYSYRSRHEDNLTFYNNLSRYNTMCYNGEGVPLFLCTHQWYRYILCLLAINAVYIFMIVVVIGGSSKGQNAIDSNKVTIFLLINIGLLLLLNISYILTLFLNPGIRNPSCISVGEGEQQANMFCAKCNITRNEKMEHCDQCQVCILNIDHHCGFFGKCIADKVIFPFYAFITLMTLSFIVMLITIINCIGI